MNLHEILITPGSRLPFRQELSIERLDDPSILEYSVIPLGEGIIENTAGALMLRGSIKARMRCTCDRCTAEFEKLVDLPLEIPLATELQDEEDPDYYLIDGDELDLCDLLETAFILGMDTQYVCKEDCKGLCWRCGANLNYEPCRCKAETDPRLAVLEQLLENKE